MYPYSLPKFLCNNSKGIIFFLKKAKGINVQEQIENKSQVRDTEI
jgi:hypothetical protein